MSASSVLPAAQNMSLEQLSRYFHLPINDVAKELGICATVLKKICRRNGIPRWPHRKIKSFEKRIANLEAALMKNPEEEARILQELNALKEKKGFLMKNPSVLGKGPKRSVTSGISKYGLKRAPMGMASDSESEDEFVPSLASTASLSATRSSIGNEVHATEQLAALQRRAALLSVMSGNMSTSPLLPSVMRGTGLAQFHVLEPTPLSYLSPSFSLLPQNALRCLPSAAATFPAPALAPYSAPEQTEADALDGLAELSKAAALEASSPPIAQDDTWRGSLVSHTGRSGVASSARVLV